MLNNGHIYLNTELPVYTKRFMIKQKESDHKLN